MLEAARALSVTFGGSIALSGTVLGACVSASRSLRRGAPPSRRALAVIGAAAAYARFVLPWMRRWGSTAQERVRPLPGDDLVPDAAFQSTRAVTVDAPAEQVWPWLAQIGQDRGGFYSYAWLENLAGCRMQNADRVHPEWQQRAIGEKVMMHPATGAPVAAFEPGRAIVLEGWGSFVVEPTADGRTRLIARNRVARGAAAVFYVTLVEIPHFVMERRMLLGIGQRAEQARQRSG